MYTAIIYVFEMNCPHCQKDILIHSESDFIQSIHICENCKTLCYRTEINEFFLKERIMIDLSKGKVVCREIPIENGFVLHEIEVDFANTYREFLHERFPSHQPLKLIFQEQLREVKTISELEMYLDNRTES